MKFPLGDQLGYDRAHRAVVAAFGRAVDHRCVDCGRQARMWSYRNTYSEHTRMYFYNSRKRLYSIDPGDYEPRCGSCHRKFDVAAALAAGDPWRQVVRPTRAGMDLVDEWQGEPDASS